MTTQKKNDKTLTSKCLIDFLRQCVGSHLGTINLSAYFHRFNSTRDNSNSGCKKKKHSLHQELLAFDNTLRLKGYALHSDN